MQKHAVSQLETGTENFIITTVNVHRVRNANKVGFLEISLRRDD